MINAKLNVPKPANEPVLEFRPGSPEKARLKKQLDKMLGEQIEIPLIIGGEEVKTGSLKDCRSPHDHQHLLAQYHAGGTPEVQAAAESGNDHAEIALQIYAYRVRKYIGAYLAVLGGADAVVFTGGVGENGAAMRARILTGLDGLGLALDADLNRDCVGREGEISAAGSPVKLLVIPTNEELLIARDTRDVVSPDAS